MTPSPLLKTESTPDEVVDTGGQSSKPRSSHHHLEDLIDQVSEWIKEERNKRAEKKFKHSTTDGSVESKDRVATHDHANDSRARRDSDASETSFDLNKLEVCPKNSVHERCLCGKDRRGENTDICHVEHPQTQSKFRPFVKA